MSNTPTYAPIKDFDTLITAIKEEKAQLDAGEKAGHLKRHLVRRIPISFGAGFIFFLAFPADRHQGSKRRGSLANPQAADHLSRSFALAGATNGHCLGSAHAHGGARLQIGKKL